MAVKLKAQDVAELLKDQRRIVDRFTFVLPWPPATGNHYKATTIRFTANRKPFIHHYVTPAAERYREDIAALVIKLGSPHIPGRVASKLSLFPPDRRSYDGDNVEKVVNDALALAGAIENDKFIDLTSRRKRFVKPGGEVVLTFRRFGENYQELFDG